MTYEFKFDTSVLALVLKGLSKLPFEESAQLIQGLQREIGTQDATRARADEAVKRAAESIVADAKQEQAKPKRKYTRKAANGAADQAMAQGD